jgi:hypothetical protein
VQVKFYRYALQARAIGGKLKGYECTLLSANIKAKMKKPPKKSLLGGFLL